MSSTPPEAAVTPQAWCRRILKSLGQQEVDGPEAGYIDMLLTYFIELDPAEDDFASLLERYCADSRPGIAEAAALLRNAWQRGRTSDEPIALPPLREVLRTLGARLDRAGARGAYITIDAERAQIHPFGGAAVTLGPRELHQVLGAGKAPRRQAPSAELQSPDRFETILEAVGEALGPMPAQSFEIVATRRSVVVDGSAGLHQVYTLAQLADLVQASAPGAEDDSPAD